MRRILPLLFILISTLGSVDAQLDLADGIWIQSDTILDERTLLHQSALLVSYTDPRSPEIHATAEQLHRLKKDFPWLNIIICTEWDNSESHWLERWYRLQGLQFPTLVINPDEYETTIKEEKLELYGPDWHRIRTTERLDPSAVETLSLDLHRIASEYNSPGRSLSYSSHTRSTPQLSDHSLLSRPTSITYDAIFDRLIVCDSGNDRIVLIDKDGEVFGTIGSGATGSSTGSFDQTELKTPTEIEFYADSALLLIIDRGNERLLEADMHTMQTREFPLKDEDGYTISFPAAPGHLNLNGSVLSVTLPGIQRIWKIDLTTHRIIDELGTSSGNTSIHKKKSKSIIGLPASSLNLGERDIVLDASTGDIIELEERSSRVLSSISPARSEELKCSLDTLSQVPLSLNMKGGDPVICDAFTGYLTGVDTESGTLFPIHWLKDTASVGMISDVCWVDETMYLLDMEHGVIHRSTPSSHDQLSMNEIQRIRDGGFEIDEFIMAKDISLLSNAQTELEIEFLLPDGYRFHPELKSELFTSSALEIYLENGDLNKGNVRLFILPDFSRNQLNLIGRLFIQETQRPAFIYPLDVQVSIPVIKGDEESKVQKDNYQLIDLLERFTSSD